MVQGDKFTEGHKGEQMATPQSGWDVLALHVPWSHREERPGRREALCDPAGRESSGKSFAPLSPTLADGQRQAASVAAPALSQHNLLCHCHQGTCKDPQPRDSWW